MLLLVILALVFSSKYSQLTSDAKNTCAFPSMMHSFILWMKDAGDSREAAKVARCGQHTQHTNILTLLLSQFSRLKQVINLHQQQAISLSAALRSAHVPQKT